MDCQPSRMNTQELESAFAEFSSASVTIAQQYKSLEQHVIALTGELKRTNNARQKELLEKKRLTHRLASILAALPAGVLVFCDSGKLVNWNQKAEDLLGINLTKKSWHDIASQNLARGVLKTGEVILENDKKVSLSVQALPQNQGRIVLLSDVTESKNLQEGWQHKERLSEIGEMMGKLAHQIRTPLSSAFLYLSRLGKKPDVDKQTKVVERLHQCLTSVQHTLDDMLLYIKGQNPIMEYCDIETLLMSVKNSFEGVSDSKSVTLVCKDHTLNKKIYVNRHALEGALLNLLKNSVEAGASSIKLNVKNSKTETRLTIDDDGSGIEAGRQSEIFNAFYTSRTNGTGLGLAIVRNVMDLHGGTVELDPFFTEGARFLLNLPEYSTQQYLRSENTDARIMV